MVDPDDVALSLTRQCRLVSIARSSFYYEGKDESLFNVQLRRRIDEQFLETPFYGSRQMTRWLRRQEIWVSRKRVRRLMRRLGLQAIFQRPLTSQPHPEHRIYPYLLRDLAITRPNQVWCSDVTYIPLARGFLYLVAVMDWANRKVLAWRRSNTLDSSFCVEALHEALDRYGSPEIFNTDQGSQFTSLAFTDVLTDAGIHISMDGKGRWVDNVFVERVAPSHGAPPGLFTSSARTREPSCAVRMSSGVRSATSVRLASTCWRKRAVASSICSRK